MERYNIGLAGIFKPHTYCVAEATKVKPSHARRSRPRPSIAYSPDPSRRASSPFGRERRPARCADFHRPRRDRIHRLHGSRQFRDQHPGRREIRLRAALGRAARQSDRHAVSGALRKARHRHRKEPRGDLPGSLSPACRLDDVGRQRDRRHGDGSCRASRRGDRIVALAAHAADRRHGGDGWHFIRHIDGRGAGLSPARIGHRRLRRDYRTLLPRRNVHRSHRLGPSRVALSGRP